MDREIELRALAACQAASRAAAADSDEEVEIGRELASVLNGELTADEVRRMLTTLLGVFRIVASLAPPDDVQAVIDVVRSRYLGDS